MSPYIWRLLAAPAVAETLSFNAAVVAVKIVVRAKIGFIIMHVLFSVLAKIMLPFEDLYVTLLRIVFYEGAS